MALTTTPSNQNSEMSLWRAELHRTIEQNPYIPCVPSPRQGAFLAYPTLEVGYGGAAGGGKSVALLMAALQYVQVPGYHAILIRRTFADLNLPAALIPMSHEWLAPTDARWNGQEHRWTFPSGATLSFGYCENANDIYRYQGAALAFVGFDELTQFPEHPYRYLFSRLRKRRELPVPLRFRAGFNPGGIGHDWVRARFVDGQTDRRRFVPAKLEDNPHLDRESYEEALEQLDGVTRAQLRHGNWDVRPEGNLFKREWFQVDIPTQRIVRRVRCWDLAATEAAPGKDPDYTAGVLMSVDASGLFWIEDLEEFRETPAKRNQIIRNVANRDGREVEIYIEQEPGSSGKSVIDQFVREILPGFPVYGVRSTGDKITRAKPFSAASENRLVRMLRGAWNKTFLDRVTGFGLPGVHDDTTDAAAGAHAQLTSGAKEWNQRDFDRVMADEPIDLDAEMEIKF